MKFKKLKFQEFQAQISYNRYIKKVQKIIKKLPKEQQVDMLMELNSHIFEAIQNNKQSDELQGINEIVNQLGEPKEIWGAMEIEARLISQKSKNKHTLKSSIQNFKIGTLYTLSYTLMVISLLFISSKIYLGEKFGFLYREGSFAIGGIVDGVFYLPKHELMGIYFIPFWGLCLILSFYFIKEIKKDEERLKLVNELAI